MRNWYINPIDIIGGAVIDKEFKMMVNGENISFYELRIFLFQKKPKKSCSQKCVRSLKVILGLFTYPFFAKKNSSLSMQLFINQRLNYSLNHFSIQIFKY